MYYFEIITENLAKVKFIWHVDNLAGLMQNVGIALITILIPFAIAVIVEILQQKRNGETDFAELDLHVVLGDLFNFSRILTSIFFLFIPALFWEASVTFIRVILLIGWFTGILLISKILKNLYRWTKGNVDEFRFNYLNETDKLENIFTVWKSVWKSKHSNVQNEVQYFSIFSQKVDILMADHKNLVVAEKLLNDFRSYLDKRLLIFMVSPDGVFSKILKWNFKIWEQRTGYIRQDEDISIWANYNNILNVYVQ